MAKTFMPAPAAARGRACRWRAAGWRRRAPAGAAPTTAGAPRRPSSAPRPGRAGLPVDDQVGHHPVAPLGVRDAEHLGLRHRRVLTEPPRHRRRRHVDPAGHDHVVQPAEHLEPAVLVDAGGVRGQEPPVDQRLRRERRVAVVPVEQHGTRDPQPSLPVDGQAHPVQPDAVVDAPTGRLRRAVRRHDRHPGRGRPLAQSGVDRSATDQDRAERPQGRGLGGVVEHPVQLGRHQRDEVEVAGRRGRRDRAVLVEQGRRVSRRRATGRRPAARRRTTPAGRAASARRPRGGAPWPRPTPGPPRGTAPRAWARPRTRTSRRPPVRRRRRPATDRPTRRPRASSRSVSRADSNPAGVLNGCP